jgi:hypothetical protein
VQASAFVDDFTGATVAANEGAKVRISGGTADTDYTLTVSGVTSASNTRIFVGTLQVRSS